MIIIIIIIIIIIKIIIIAIVCIILFILLYTMFTSNKSSSTIFPRDIQPCNITSWVQFFIHCHESPALSVHFLQFILIPLKRSSIIPHNGDCPSVQYHCLISSIQFNLQNQFFPPEILIPQLIFHFVFFYSVILQYPQVFISIFFYLSYLFTTW